jgi:hypothetical protein
MDLGSHEFNVNARAWFQTVFQSPEETRVYGFHPCAIYLDPVLYDNPYTVPNCGPRFLGGDFDSCWCMTFTTMTELGVRYWVQHGENPEARRSFDWTDRDVYPPFRQRMEDHPVSQWLRAVHTYEDANPPPPPAEHQQRQPGR